MKTYLVGGAVRDELLGLPKADKDWVVLGSSTNEMLERGFLQIGKDFPVFLHPKTKEEYALARIERKTAPGYKGFLVKSGKEVTLEEDLYRRDFTINAIAKDKNGTLIDPYGGKEDLKNKIIRHISPAFIEDPVRVLRLARFSAKLASLGFKIADETVTLVQQMVANGETESLIYERVWVELENALSENTPSQFFTTLIKCNALESIFPKISAIFKNEIENSNYQTRGKANLSALDYARKTFNNPTVSLAVVLFNPISDNASSALSQPPINLPKNYARLHNQLNLLFGNFKNASQDDPESLLITLEKLDQYRNPKSLDIFLQACEVIAKTYYANNENANLFKRAYRNSKTINTQQLIEAGFSGKTLGEEIRKMRLSAIKKIA